MLGSPILYLKAMRILMFQLSGFDCKSFLSSFLMPTIRKSDTQVKFRV